MQSGFPFCCMILEGNRNEMCTTFDYKIRNYLLYQTHSSYVVLPDSYILMQVGLNYTQTLPHLILCKMHGIFSVDGERTQICTYLLT